MYGLRSPIPGRGANRAPGRSHERSDHFRGLPSVPPSYMVIETVTGGGHGIFESLAGVATCLAFARLSPDEVAHRLLRGGEKRVWEDAGY